MATVPPRPTLRSATALNSSQIRVIFTGNGDGGSVILEWQIGYGTHPTSPQGYVDSDGNTILGGFSPGQRIYFWARGRNAVGWGPWSNRGSAVTWRVPSAPNPPTFRNITMTSVRVEFVDGDNGGTPILERMIGYGLDPEAPLFLTSIPSGNVLSFFALEPGGTYYFWSRTRNAVGWSPWSARSQLILVAGARVRYGSVWRRAVPYVFTDGEWKVAQPMVKRLGIWRDPTV